MIKELLKKSALLMTVMAAVQYTLMAQDAEVEITDDELKTYALGMNKIDSLKKSMSADYNALIKAEEAIKGGKRFNELKKAAGDEAQLKAIDATEEELAAFSRIQEVYTTMKADLQAASVEIIKGDIGAAIYNKVKRALKSDEAVKARYKEIADSLKPAEDEEDT